MDAEILAAAKVYKKRHPRRDLRGYQSCKDKIDRIKLRQEYHNEELPKCIHETETKEMKQTSCCGFQRVFDCKKLKHEVYHSKCKSCEFYRIPTIKTDNRCRKCVLGKSLEDGKIKCTSKDGCIYKAVLFLLRKKNLQRVNERFGNPLKKNGYKIDSIPFVKGELGQGVENWYRTKNHGVKPLAVISWEEHGNTFLRSSTTKLAKILSTDNIAFLHADLGNFNHMHTQILDAYLPNGKTLIDYVWGQSDLRIDNRMINYCKRVRNKLHESKELPRLIKEKYAILWTQTSPYLTTRKECKGSWRKLADELQKELGSKIKLFVKMGPIKAMNHEEIPYKIFHDNKDKYQNVVLARDAVVNIFVTSSVCNEFVLWGLKNVVAIGRSRFSNRNVFDERFITKSLHKYRSESFDESSRKKWLNFWFKYSYYPENIVEHFEEVRKIALAAWNPIPITTATPIYLTDKTKKITTECLNAIHREFPTERKLIMVDLCDDNKWLEQWIRKGFEVIPLFGDKPPRLNKAYELASNLCKTKYLFTIESDVILPPNTRNDLVLDDLERGNIDAYELTTVDEKGNPNYPLHNRKIKDYKKRMMRDRIFPTWCATIWNVDKLKEFDFNTAPSILWLDRKLCKTMKIKANIDTHIKCRHYCKTSRIAAARN